MKLFSTKQNINWIAITTIAIACLFMHLVLRFGLPLDNTTKMQMVFITSNETAWHLGWLSWNFAAIALFVFTAFMYSFSQRSHSAKLGLFFVFIGLIPDLTAEYLFSFELADLAKIQATDKFIATELYAMNLTGLYANGLYNMGGIILTIILHRERFLPTWIALIGIISWSLGLTLSLFMFLGDIAASEWATALAMTVSLLFMSLVNSVCFSGSSYLEEDKA